MDEESLERIINAPPPTKEEYEYFWKEFEKVKKLKIYGSPYKSRAFINLYTPWIFEKEN